jgi:hypothetical protein
MPSLRDLQHEFMGALLSGESTVDASLTARLAAQGAAALRRLDVYRTHVQANFTESLRSSFPAVFRLVGEDYFRQVARAFHALHPSRSGDLRHVGRAFPDYLAELHPGGEHRYLSDVARFEWLCQETLLAAEQPPLDLDRLRRIGPSAYESLRFRLHPALRLYESPYPVLRIWKANVLDDAEPELIDLAAGADRLAMIRRRLQLEFHPLSRGEHAFLEALEDGTAFGAAIDAASACGDAFDASAALQRFVLAEAIVDFQ